MPMAAPVDDTVLQCDRLIDRLPQLLFDRVEPRADSRQQLTLHRIQYPLINTSKTLNINRLLPNMSKFYGNRGT